MAPGVFHTQVKHGKRGGQKTYREKKGYDKKEREIKKGRKIKQRNGRG